jgi:hypothetical protein
MDADPFSVVTIDLGTALMQGSVLLRLPERMGLPHFFASVSVTRI